MWQGTEGSLQLTISKEAIGLAGHKEPNPAKNYVSSEEDPSLAQLSAETPGAGNTFECSLVRVLSKEKEKERTKQSYARIPDSQTVR